VSSGSNCRHLSVGPLPVSRMARVVRSKPSVRNNLTTSLKLDEGMNTHAVPSGGFPRDTPGGRFGQFFPARREDLYLLVALRFVGGGGTTAPVTRFPRRPCPPGPARGSSSSSPLDGGALPIEMPGTSRVTDALPAGDPGTLRALGAVALVGGGRAVPVGGGGTVAGESNSLPEDPGRTPTTGARPPPGAGRTSTLAESQRGGAGAHPSPLDGQRPEGAQPFGPPRVAAVGSSSGAPAGGIPTGPGSSRSVDALSLEEEKRQRRDLQRAFGVTPDEVARAQWQRSTRNHWSLDPPSAAGGWGPSGTRGRWRCHPRAVAARGRHRTTTPSGPGFPRCGGGGVNRGLGRNPGTGAQCGRRVGACGGPRAFVAVGERGRHGCPGPRVGYTREVVPGGGRLRGGARPGSCRHPLRTVSAIALAAGAHGADAEGRGSAGAAPSALLAT